MRTPAAAGLVGAALLLLAHPAGAADVAGARDYPGMPRFEGSSIVGSQTLPFDAFTLPTGPVRQDDQFRWQLTEKVETEGKVSGYVYAVPKGRSTLEVFRNYETTLKDLGFETLFACDGDETCGNADVLAQQVYQGSHVMENGGLRSAQAVIYGDDTRYLAAKRARDGQDTYASLLVAREAAMGGEDQDTLSAVLHLIEPRPMGDAMVLVDAAKMESDIDASGRVSLYGILFDTDSAVVKAESDPTLAEIGKLLAADPALKLYVVGHTDNAGGYDHNQRLSARRAEAVVKALTARFGVQPGRLRPAGVGFLAPVGPNTSEEGRARNRRVELVKE